MTGQEQNEHGMTLIFEYVTPGLNMMLKMPWQKRKKIKDVVRRLVLDACWGKPRYTKVRFEYTRISPYLLDQTNLSGSFKVWEDEIVRAGIIPDDSPDYVPFTTQCFQEKGPAKTIIRIYCIE